MGWEESPPIDDVDTWELQVEVFRRIWWKITYRFRWLTCRIIGHKREQWNERADRLFFCPRCGYFYPLEPIEGKPNA